MEKQSKELFWKVHCVARQHHPSSRMCFSTLTSAVAHQCAWAMPLHLYAMYATLRLGFIARPYMCHCIHCIPWVGKGITSPGSTAQCRSWSTQLCDQATAFVCFHIAS